MATTVSRWGNGLSVRLPRAVAEAAGVCEGAAVDVRPAGRGVVIVSAARPRYRLADLLAGVRRENAHPETAWGEDTGREAW